MAKTKNQSGQKLSLDATLRALDEHDRGYYDRLTPEERKGYSPFILMRYMSSVGPQSHMQPYAVLATNDLVNVGFFSLGKHPELQHLLLCLAGLGKKQYRPYVGAKNAASKTKVVDSFLRGLHPEASDDEIGMLRSMHNAETIKQLGRDAGLSDAEIKELAEDAKKLERDT
jgi:hypothetical protein